jgi:hypothetical protein
MDDKCRRRVKSCGLTLHHPLQVQPEQRTLSDRTGMSQRCQDRKSRFLVQVSEQRLSDPHNTFLRRYSETHRRAVAIAYEDALAEIELANSFSAANAGPPTSPPEARQRPGTRGIVQRMERRRPSPLRTPMRRPERWRLPATRNWRDLAAPEPIAAHSSRQ